MSERKTLIFLSGFLGFLGLLCYLMARPLLGPIVFACLVAVAFFPLHKRLAKKIRWPSVGAFFSTVIIYAAILLPLAFIGVTVGREIAGEYSELKKAAEPEGGVGQYLQNKMNAVIRVVAPRLQMEEPELAQELTTRLEAAFNWIAPSFALGLRAIISLITNAGLAAVILFFFLRDGPAIRNGIVELLPLKQNDSERLLDVIRDSIRANLHGVIGVAAAQAGALTLGLNIAGVPSPFTWGAISALFAMIPMVGTAVVWVPAVIWLLVTGSYGMGIFLAIWGVLVVGLLDNIVRPLMVSGETNQHPMLIFLSILGGLSAFGPMGLFLGPLIISVTVAVFGVFRKEVSPETKA